MYKHMYKHVYKHVNSYKCSLALNEDYSLVQRTQILRLVYNLRKGCKISF